MLKNLRNPTDTSSAMLSLLPTSGTMAGISIGLMGVVNLRQTPTISSVADDMLLFSALGFLLVCYLIFFALRRVHVGLSYEVPSWQGSGPSRPVCGQALQYGKRENAVSCRPVSGSIQ